MHFPALFHLVLGNLVIELTLDLNGVLQVPGRLSKF